MVARFTVVSLVVTCSAAGALGCDSVLGNLHNEPFTAADSGVVMVGGRDGGGDAEGSPDVGCGSGCTEAGLPEAAPPPSDGSADTGSTPPGTCTIGGMSYASGAPDPATPCSSCDPAMSTSAWTNAADGTSCGTGGICHIGTCVSGCEIGGVYYAAMAVDPNNPCSVCAPAASTQGWSSASDGTTCGNGQVCSGGQCGSGCNIGGTSYVPEQLDPSNPCLECAPGTSTGSWTSVSNGTSCQMSTGGTGMCASGACTAASCAGGVMQTWSEAQPAWDNNTNTAGTYTCSGLLPTGTVPSGQSVMVSAAGTTVTGSATYECESGVWTKTAGTCDGVVYPTIETVTCTSTDPATNMFVGFYATYLFRCADQAGLAYWVGNYNGASPPCPANMSASSIMCWAMSFDSGGNGEIQAANMAGHVASSVEQSLCGMGGGYPWSMSETYIESSGTQCKTLP